MGKVDINSLKPNSYAYRNGYGDGKKEDEPKKEKEKLKQIIDKNKIASTKKPFSKKILDAFLPEDVHDVKEWLITDVAIPFVKNSILDGISMMFYGEPIRRGSSMSRRPSSRIDYSGISRRTSEPSRRRNGDYYDSDDKVDFRNIVLNNRKDAEIIVDEMRNRIEATGGVSIADLLDLIGCPSRYTDNNYGWNDERDINVRRVSSGYLIDVMEPRYLD